MPSPVQRRSVSVQATGVDGRGTWPRGTTPSARSLIATAVLLVASSVASRAQDRVPFRGWVGLGLGAGPANIACNGCTSGWNLHGYTLLGSVGVMITPQLGIGLGLDQWVQSPEDSEATNTLTVLLHYYPIDRAGAFVEAGVGYSQGQARLNRSTTGARGDGLALMAAVGYDVRVFRFEREDGTYDVNLTPRVSYVYSSIGDLRYADSRTPFATGWRHQVLSVGLEVSLRMR